MKALGNYVSNRAVDKKAECFETMCQLPSSQALIPSSFIKEFTMQMPS